MAKAPNTTVVLYKDTALTPTAQRAFNNKAAQDAWFNARASETFTGLSHVRHTVGTVELDIPVGEVLQHDYLSIDNKAYGGRFFCYLLDAEHISDRNTKISFMIDAWQSYQFEMEMLPSEIVRQGLTETDHNASWLNKYDANMIELTASEDLAVTEDLEMKLARERGIVTPNGRLRKSPSDPKLIPDGAAGLTVEFGGSNTTDLGNIGPDYVFELIYSFDMMDRMVRYEAAVNALNNTVMVRLDYAASGANMTRNTFLVSIGQRNVSAGASLYHPGDLLSAVNLFQGAMQEAPDMSDQVIGATSLPGGFIQDLINVSPTSTQDVNNDTKAEIKRVVSKPYSQIYGREPHNAKLYRSPFRCVRLRRPDGVEFYYQFERSQIMEDGNAAVEFALYRLFDNFPTMVALPLGYAGNSADTKRAAEYSDFPQLYYTSGKYGAYISQKYQQAILSDTPGTKNSRDYGYEALSEGVSVLTQGLGAVGLGTFLGGKGGPATAVLGAGTAMAQQASNLNAQIIDMGSNKELMDAAYATAGGKDVPIPRSLALHADAFGGQNYSGGNNSGTIGQRLGDDQWVAEVVTLRPEVLFQYDNFLSNFGHRSGKVGVPNIVQSAANAHYAPVGDGSSLTTHFCKTNGARVYGVPSVFARDIERMFDGGVNFYR